MEQDDIGRLLGAIRYASEKHAGQLRKGSSRIPYINHPIAVTQLLFETGVTEVDILIAGALHDVVEDTSTPVDDIEDFFGKTVASWVLEVTDDMSSAHQARKEAQIRTAQNLSSPAKMIRIADKICNLRDLMYYPIAWDKEKKQNYMEWTEKVVSGCRGVNPVLDAVFEETIEKFLLYLKTEETES